jgi:hypothetical protein
MKILLIVLGSIGLMTAAAHLEKTREQEALLFAGPMAEMATTSAMTRN